MKNKYTIYIPSKGRHDRCLTANILKEDGLNYYIVVEPQDYQLYIKEHGKKRVLVLPFSNLGQGVTPARNWIKQHSINNGKKFHWQIDDDMKWLGTYSKGKAKKEYSGFVLDVGTCN